jgi:hypothetical protein
MCILDESWKRAIYYRLPPWRRAIPTDDLNLGLSRIVLEQLMNDRRPSTIVLMSI